MAERAPGDFLSGVIEGFYGPPWSPTERGELFGWMRRWGLNAYLYGPKDDLKHRAIWREPYTETEVVPVKSAIETSQAHGVRFLYAIGPGLDLRYAHHADTESLKGRFDQLLRFGCRHFALLFDDIPDRMDPADLARWGSLAAAQCHVSNEIFRWLRQRDPATRLAFCPTPYCGRMAMRAHGGADYLATVGRELWAEIDIFWTGPEIISREITVEHVREVAGLLRRPPLLWDNLHANDYDGRRFFCGPYAGRPPELRRQVAGILTNPNTEFPLNFVPLQTLGAYLQNEGAWDPRAAYLKALREWHAAFAVAGAPLKFEDLVLLGDAYYLPYETGPEAAELLALTRRLLQSDPASWGREVEEFRSRASRLREFCGRLVELRQRPLFNALSRRIWELREELDLLEKYVAFRSVPSNRGVPFTSDFHQPETYRGAYVARLQRLLDLRPDASFVPAPPSA